jgi:hypothetical protein
VEIPSNDIVKKLLEDGADEADPKEMGMEIKLGSDLFEQFMQNYRNECLNLLQQAKASGALSGSEPEGIVIRVIMKIAAEKFNVESIVSGQYRKMAKNLDRMIG